MTVLKRRKGPKQDSPDPQASPAPSSRTSSHVKPAASSEESGNKQLRTVNSFRLQDLNDGDLPEAVQIDHAPQGTSTKQHHKRGHRRQKRRRAVQFVVAILMVCLAGLWLNLDSLTEDARLMATTEWKLPGFLGDLSVSFSGSPLLEAFQDQYNMTIQSLRTSLGSGNESGPDGGPGAAALAKGWKAKHPVIVIPGFVTSGLELWAGTECGRRYFRQRMWGTLGMMQAYLRDADCWFKHMSLDPDTGLDPENIKIRAANGLEAIDYFVHGYWVWNKLVEALGELGYDTNNLVALSFDWRLAVPLMEVRDGYFTRLRREVETMHALQQAKVVLISHSYGESVSRAFYTWADEQQPGWLEEHLEAHVSIAGPTLGIPKAITALLSGEMRDTAQLGGLASYVANNIIPMESRARLFRTWGSLLAMLPVGGNKVWGNTSWAPDDTEEVRNANSTFGAMLTVQKVMNIGDGSRADTAERDAETNNNHESTKPNGSAYVVDVVPDEVDQLSAAAAGGAGGLGNGSIGNRSSGNSKSKDGSVDVSSGGLTGALMEFLHLLPSADAEQLGQPELYDVEQAIQAMLEAANLGLRYSSWGPQCPSANSSAASRNASDAAREGVRADRVYVPFPDATKAPLPAAPSFSMYCMYGTGLKTERSYHYLYRPSSRPPSRPNDPTAVGIQTPIVDNESSGLLQGLLQSPRSGQEELTVHSDRRGVAGGKEVSEKGRAMQEEAFNWRIHTARSHLSTDLGQGVQMGDGDLTVPLLSLGAMCHKGWRTKRLNPSGIRIVTREKVHAPIALDPRGGPSSAQHVDIMGNNDMLMDVLAVVSGHGSELRDQVHSNIGAITARIDWGEEELNNDNDHAVV